MRRNDFLGKVNEMLENGIYSYEIPTKQIDSGKASKGFEGLIKLLLNNTRGSRVVSSPRGTDTFKNIDGVKSSFEVKTNAGELIQIDYNNKEVKSVFNNDYVIYNPDFIASDSLDYILEHTYVTTGSMFKDILEVANGTRLKYSTAEKNLAESLGIKPRHDRITIRSTKRGDKKRDDIINALDSMAIKFTEFCEEHNIKLNYKGL